MLDKSTDRILRRMDRMGFAGAGEALREIERLSKQVTQRSARMQVMREWMTFGLSGPTQNLWEDFKYDNPEAAEWLDQDGVPR